MPALFKEETNLYISVFQCVKISYFSVSMQNLIFNNSSEIWHDIKMSRLFIRHVIRFNMLDSAMPCPLGVFYIIFIFAFCTVSRCALDCP